MTIEYLKRDLAKWTLTISILSLAVMLSGGCSAVYRNDHVAVSCDKAPLSDSGSSSMSWRPDVYGASPTPVFNLGSISVEIRGANRRDRVPLFAGPALLPIIPQFGNWGRPDWAQAVEAEGLSVSVVIAGAPGPPTIVEVDSRDMILIIGHGGRVAAPEVVRIRDGSADYTRPDPVTAGTHMISVGEDGYYLQLTYDVSKLELEEELHFQPGTLLVDGEPEVLPHVKLSIVSQTFVKWFEPRPELIWP